MFYLIGLGLGDPKDITVKGLEIVKSCERVYLESYTSILTCGQAVLVNIRILHSFCDKKEIFYFLFVCLL